MVTVASPEQHGAARSVCGAGELDRQPCLPDPGLAGQVRQVRPAGLRQQRVQPGQLRAPADEHAPVDPCQQRRQRRALGRRPQRLPVGRLDLRGRVGPELLTQQLSAALVGQQRLGPVPGAQLRAHQVQVPGLAQRTQRQRLLGAAHRLGRLRARGEHVQGSQQHPVQPVALRRDPLAILLGQERPSEDLGDTVGVHHRPGPIIPAGRRLRVRQPYGRHLDVDLRSGSEAQLVGVSTAGQSGRRIQVETPEQATQLGHDRGQMPPPVRRQPTRPE